MNGKRTEQFEQLNMADPLSGQFPATGWWLLIHPSTKAHPLLMMSKVMARLRGEKPSSICNITAELFYARGEAMIHKLYAVLTAIWQADIILPDWKRGAVVPTRKGEGNCQDCNTYHDITLFSVPGKVLTHILLMFQPTVESVET